MMRGAKELLVDEGKKVHLAMHPTGNATG